MVCMILNVTHMVAGDGVFVRHFDRMGGSDDMGLSENYSILLPRLENSKFRMFCE